MPEAFKNVFNSSMIHGMAAHFKQHWPAFDDKRFIRMAMKNLRALALKARSQQITQAMIQYLPDNYPHAGEIMLASLYPVDGSDIADLGVGKKGIGGWAMMPMTHYVALQGQNDFTLSMNLLKEMTQRFSAEFDIRFFLLAAQDETMAVLHTWASDENYHVRRLVSEGTRPRLPWAMCLPPFVENPAPVIALLEKLKDDPEEYVRRSVANNLNDISKDHPDVVADIAARWMKDASKNRARLVRHACRSLLKAGHKKTLKVLGFGPPRIHNVSLQLLTPKVVFGEKLQFELSLTSRTKQAQQLMVDYVVHHQKANGSTSPKVFKWRSITLGPGGVLNGIKNHAMKKITTRVYYPGAHKIEIMVNGVSVATADFQLIMP
ncbi:MAG: DNA alkylation repair protein [Gammaproteobacteria bacterium]|nr:DNA alkylation repair protein [Gammaproteobacteria bacterium]